MADVALALGIMILVALSMAISGCTRGAKISFEYAPISEIHDSQHLYQDKK